MNSVEPPWPLNEPARLNKLAGYRVLDTPPEPAFDRLTRLASRHFHVPIALINLVDESRQWCKARYGLTSPSIARRLSFCSYTILNDEVMIVPDLQEDERFTDNELVTGPPHLRFYAGAPLRTPDGLLIGTFCIIDVQPHPAFGNEERRDLEEFARIVMEELEARAAQRERDAAEVRFRAVVEHTPQLMWVNRPDGDVEFYNAAWRAYTGRSATEATRWDDIHPDDHAAIRELREQAIAKGEPYQFEMRLRRLDGVWRRFLARITPMREDGRITAWIGTAADVDDIHRAREAAEEADRSKSRFLAAASHDLRQPLQSVLLFAEALRPHVDAQRGHPLLDRLQQGLDTLKDLLDGLLDVSRLNAGIVAPQIEAFPITELISPLAAAYAPLAEAKGLRWEAAPCPDVVRSDRVLLGRMLRNLIDNAVRYTEHGRVLLDCTVQGALLSIAVCDTGIGIPPDQHVRIFEEFHQVGNPERDREQGLGLGLAVVKRLSRLLDHPVEFASSPGRGSVFSIAVPLVRQPVRPAVPSPPPPEPEPEPEPPQAGRFAVVVDDDAIVLMGLAAMLREWGYEVLTAGSTDQAMERLRAADRRPDIVLVDYRLRQGRVGTEAVLRIRGLFDDAIPAVIITGEIGPEPQRDAAAHGLELIHKPVTPRLLEATLTRYLAATAP